MPERAPLDHPETPFPIGVEYYRAPIPKQDVWDGDFARISAAGFRIVRSFSMWNWMEPRPGQYELDDFDLLFDLAAKHGLSVWLDLTLATHGACPEWLMREYPDILSVNDRGERSETWATAATPQGSQVHCYDHPAWREYGGALLRHVVNRYKDRPNLLIWGLWDGISPVHVPSPRLGSSFCYCEHTIARYKTWLRSRYTLDELNTHVLRRYRRWEDVEPPRSNHNVVEMLLYHEFHYENLAGHMRWMADETTAIDPHHEIRAHAAAAPRPWDERCAALVDSWGMSMSSNNMLTSDDLSTVADRAFAFDWSRSVGRNGRWWNEEIYAGMARGGATWKKQSDPRELTTLLWLTLAGGAAGCMFWQYRPEYLSFESPGYNLVALDGEPTPRFDAVARAIEQIDGMRDHLPLECPRSEVGIVYHPLSQDLFDLNDENARYLADIRGLYRTLWTNGIPTDIVTPRMDWSDYRMLFLPNLALMTDEVRERIARTLEESPETRLVAEGSFGMYSAAGLSSYCPPEGFADIFKVRVADLSRVTEHDIEQGRNVLKTPYGAVTISSECGYAVLEPLEDTEAIAWLGDDTVAVRTADGRFTWYGLTLSAGFGDVASPRLALGLTSDAGVHAPVGVEGGRVVPIVRQSRQGGWLVFVFNLERGEAQVTLKPRWRSDRARDLLAGTEVPLAGNASQLAVEQWGVGVVHCEER